MATITRIQISGFKAFSKNFTLDLSEGQNLLIYGENGSGKSSLYYALHVIIQSVFKDDRGAKYFLPLDPGGTIENIEHLINLNRLEEAKDASEPYYPFIELTFDDGKKWQIDHSGLMSPDGGIDDEIIELNKHSIFINHSYISRFRIARNSEDINLWDVFHKDIITSYLIPDSKNLLLDLYEDIIEESKAIPAPDNKSIQDKIDLFNANMLVLIGRINGRASKIYNDFFKDEDDNDIEIELLYLTEDDPHNRYREKYFLQYFLEDKDSVVPILHIPRIGLNVMYQGHIINKPQSFFNEAKMTAIALAVRFACLPRVHYSGAFIALDDMLISMDMSNRIKVVRYLLDALQNHYKLYVFSHDRLFYHTFKRVIETQYNRSEWIFAGIYSNDLEFPVSPVLKLDANDKIMDIKETYARHDYFRCGTLMRLECERCLNELLPDSYKVTEDPQTKATIQKTLDGKILSLEEFCQKESIDFIPFKNLKIYKDLFLNSTAHNDITSPFYKNEIKACLKSIESLSKINRYKELPCNQDIKFLINDKNGGSHLVGIKRREPIKILEYNGTSRISYFSRCTLVRIVHGEEKQEINEGYESLYEVYYKVCAQFGIEPTQDLLDILQDRAGYIKANL